MITSLQNEKIKELMKLKQKKYRDEMNLFLVEGFHLVEEARKNGCIQTLVTTLDDDFAEDTLYVSESVMSKLAFTKSPQPLWQFVKKTILQKYCKTEQDIYCWIEFKTLEMLGQFYVQH